MATLANPPAGKSFHRMARFAGILYLFCIVLGLSGEFVSKTHPAYANLASVGGAACYIGVTVLLYILLKPASPTLSLVAAIFSLTGCVLMFVDTFHFAKLPIEPIVFFGPYCLLLGYLILSSALLPRIVGAFLLLTGLGWLSFIYHPLAHYTARYAMSVGLLGEGTLTLSLLFSGVWNREKTLPADTAA